LTKLYKLYLNHNSSIMKLNTTLEPIIKAVPKWSQLRHVNYRNFPKSLHWLAVYSNVSGSTIDLG